MGKTNDRCKANTSKADNATIASKPQKRGLDEIDNLFAQKKKSDKELREKIIQEKEASKQERKRRKQARLEEEADEIALRGASSAVIAAGSSSATTTSTAAGKRKGDAVAPASLFERAAKLPSLTYTRVDVEKLDKDKDKWATDGLGGVFNGEGYTGRRDDGGHRVFKAHLMNKKGFGQTPDCPFDCSCCFI